MTPATEHRKLAAIAFTDMAGLQRAGERIDKAPNSPKMEPVSFIARKVQGRLRAALARQKSVLLLGPGRRARPRSCNSCRRTRS